MWFDRIKYTATFYYQSNTTSGSTTVTSTTASCKVDNTQGTCTITIPTAVTGSVGTYNNAYYGLSTSTGNMTAAVAKSATTITLSADATSTTTTEETTTTTTKKRGNDNSPYYDIDVYSIYF